MKVATYDSLLKELKGWSNRNDITDEQYGSFIYMAGSLASQTLRVVAMENVELLDVSPDGHVVIPPDYLQLKALSHAWDTEDSVPLSRIAWDQYINYLNADINAFAPHFFARQGPYWFIAPKPPAGGKVTCHYYRTMPDINPDEQTNWLVQMSPLTYLYGALHFFCLFTFDEERAEFWLKKFQSELIRIQEMNDNSEYAGASLAVRSKEYNGDL